MGIQDAPAACTECGHQFSVPLASIEAPGETILDEIGSARPLACPECSGPGEIDVALMGFDEEDPGP